MKKTQKEFLSSRVRYIPINTVRPNPQQPRRSFDETALRELADSIRAYGILQPLTVRDKSGFYELVAGERRLRAARIAGLREGLRFAAKRREAILRREQALLAQTAELLSALPELELFTGDGCQSGVLSLRPRAGDPAALCEALAERGVCVRGGLHCSPLAHRSAGTLPEGTVRLSFSAFSTPDQAEDLARILKESLKTC